MMLHEVAEKYHVNILRFEKYVEDNNIPHRKTRAGTFFDDSKIDDIVKQFIAYDSVEREKKEAEQEFVRERKILTEMEETMKRKAMAEMLITSGFNFDGYRVVKYSGYISGDDAMCVSRGLSFLGSNATKAKDGLMASLSKIRRNALKELKEAAYDLGCNAIIGVDFDYITLEPESHNLLNNGTTLQPYVFGVTANCNAVIIEKIEE